MQSNGVDLGKHYQYVGARSSSSAFTTAIRFGEEKVVAFLYANEAATQPNSFDWNSTLIDKTINEKVVSYTNQTN